MASKYAVFDRSRLQVKPLGERVNDLDAAGWLALDEIAEPYSHAQLPELAARVVQARERGAARVLMMGAHVIRAGVNRQIIDLIERGFIDHVAMNGAGAIHDYELARIVRPVARDRRTQRPGARGCGSKIGFGRILRAVH
jgi:hypothetical protein